MDVPNTVHETRKPPSILKPPRQVSPITYYNPPLREETKDDASLRGYYYQNHHHPYYQDPNNYSPPPRQNQTEPQPSSHHQYPEDKGIDLLGEHALPIEHVMEAAQSLGVGANVLVQSAINSGYALFSRQPEHTIAEDGRTTPMSKSTTCTLDSSYMTNPSSLETSSPGWMYAPEEEKTSSHRIPRDIRHPYPYHGSTTEDSYGRGGEFKEDLSAHHLHSEQPQQPQNSSSPPLSSNETLRWTKHFATDAGELLLGPTLFGKCSRTCTKTMISTQEVMVTTWGDKSLTELSGPGTKAANPDTPCHPPYAADQATSTHPTTTMTPTTTISNVDHTENHTPALTRAESITSDDESLEYPDDELTMISTISLDEPARRSSSSNHHKSLGMSLPHDQRIVVVTGSSMKSSRNTVGAVGSSGKGATRGGVTRKSPFQCLLCKPRGKSKMDEHGSNDDHHTKNRASNNNSMKKSIEKDNSRNKSQGRRQRIPTRKLTNNDTAAAYQPQNVDPVRPKMVSVGVANSITAGSDGASSISLSELGALTRRQNGTSSGHSIGEKLDKVDAHRRGKSRDHDRNHPAAEADPVSVFL